MSIHDRSIHTDAAIARARRIARIALEEDVPLSAGILTEAADTLARSGSPLDWDRARDLRRRARLMRLLDPGLLAIAAVIVWGVALVTIVVGGR